MMQPEAAYDGDCAGSVVERADKVLPTKSEIDGMRFHVPAKYAPTTRNKTIIQKYLDT